MFVTSVGLVFMFRDSAFLQILKQVSNWPLCLLLHKYIWYLYSLSSPQFDVPCHISCTLNKGIIAGEESVSSHLQSSHWCLHLRQVLSSRFVWISGHRWCQTCHNRTDCKWENLLCWKSLNIKRTWMRPAARCPWAPPSSWGRRGWGTRWRRASSRSCPLPPPSPCPTSEHHRLTFLTSFLTAS